MSNYGTKRVATFVTINLEKDMAKDKRKEREINYGSAKSRVEKRGSGFENTTLNVPEGTKFFNPKKAGTYRLDIIPFVAGKYNPYADKGHVHFERTYWVHRGIGAESNSFTCLQKTFRKPCPICEYVAKQKRNAKADPDALKELEPKERQLWRVIDRSEPDEGIQLWDVSFFLFGKMLDAKIKNSDEDDHYDEFFRLDRGMTVKVGMEEESFQGYSFTKATDIEFKPRKESLDNSLIDEGPNPDECVKETPYAELKRIFLQIDGESAKDKDEDEDEIKEPSDLATDEEEEQPKKSKKKLPAKTGKKPKPKPSEDEEEEEDGDSELDSGDEDDDGDDSDTDDEDGDEGGDESDEDDEDGDSENGEDEDSESEDEEEDEGGDEEEDSELEEDGEGDEDETPSFSVGDKVFHDEHGNCTVVHVSGDGSSIRIKDSDGEVHRAIDPADLTVRKGKEEKPSTKKSSAKKGIDPFEDEDEDEPTPPKKPGKKPKK